MANWANEKTNPPPRAVIIRCRNRDCKYEHTWHRPELLVDFRCPECGRETYMTPTTDVVKLGSPWVRPRDIDDIEWEEPECQ